MSAQALPEEASEDAMVARLDSWLREWAPAVGPVRRIEKFAFGQSNPTYRLHAPSGDYVLRRKPSGPLLPKAHAIEREFRVIKALQGSGVPVPGTVAFCDDPAVIGTPFYVMGFVEGRIFYDQRLPDLGPAERHAIFDGMNAAVAQLHAVDPGAVGLSDFGRGEGFLARQVSLWTQQYRASQTSPDPAMEALIAWLPRHLPPEQPARIFHGDLRLDNMIFHPREPRVIAILDWELSTLGDPLADAAYNMMLWQVAPDLFRGLRGLDTPEYGVPSADSYLRRYCERTGRDTVEHWNFYLAFSLFRVAAILFGVLRRALDGQASAADALDVGAKAAPLAALGWEIAQHGPAGPSRAA